MDERSVTSSSLLMFIKRQRNSFRTLAPDCLLQIASVLLAYSWFKLQLIMKTVLHVIGLFGLLARLVTAQLDSDMGPAAFLWPTDRAYSAANDNTAPCGSAAGVSNRTSFPMSRFFSITNVLSMVIINQKPANGAVAIVLQDESYNINLAISYSDSKQIELPLLGVLLAVPGSNVGFRSHQQQRLYYSSLIQ